MNHTRMHRSIGLLGAIAVGLVALPSVAAMMAPPSVAIVSPAMGTTIAGATIPVTVSVNNFKIECSRAGQTRSPSGGGHIHAMLDGMNMAHLTTMACADHFAISTQGLRPGKHVLTVVLANDAHAMNSLPVSTSFTYAPSRANPLPDAMTSGKPTVEILSPKNGASVGRTFDILLAVHNFDLSCGLEGKSDVSGWGHIHVMVQQQGETTASPMTPMVAMMKTPAGMAMGRSFMNKTHVSMEQMAPMMAMAEPSLIGMPCSQTVPVDLSEWHAGPTRIIVQLANDDHMPTGGAAPAMLSVTVR